MRDTEKETIERAAGLLAECDAVLVAAGAGMGVDSGLPDFRGDEGFWRAYPAYRHLGLSFMELANPAWFRDDPTLAWGFYGHRLNLYRATAPHAGFGVLRRWIDRAGQGFVFTSNVDGQFQTADFPSGGIVECHGSLHYLQCTRPCREAVWPSAEVAVEVDAATGRAEGPLPKCRHCGALARPNVLMFGDWHWCGARSEGQQEAFQTWLGSAAGQRMVIVECGAGTAVPTVRYVCESTASRYGATLIRINPREPEAPRGALSIAGGALEALMAIDACGRTP